MERTFENWLVVSDIDGTLNNKIRKLPRRNYEAIKNSQSLVAILLLLLADFSPHLREIIIVLLLINLQLFLMVPVSMILQSVK